MSGQRFDGQIGRREFVASASAAVAAAAVPLAVARGAYAGGSDALKVGIIGCGGRGSGAAMDALAADPATHIVALADVMGDRVESARNNLAGQAQFGERSKVRPDRCYVGFDAYERLLASDVQYVVLATSPHFRPIHLEAAVNANKHVFMEKPAGVDPAGVRRVIAAGKAADAKGLSIVAGTQRRHERCYLEAMHRVHQGAIGKVVAARAYWNQGGLWVHKRKPEYTDMEWQIRNWLYFCWQSGDHIVEQHVHNLDAVNWAVGAHPLKAVGMGGRQVRTGEEYGNIFDHFAIEYEYPGGVRMTSMCRQIDGCASAVKEVIVGTDGECETASGSARITGSSPWTFQGEQNNPYVQEHADLIASIRGGTRFNEAAQVAESTLTAVMGRMSAYTGKEVTWDQAMASTLDLSPPTYAFGPLPASPVPVPGRTPLV